MKFVIIGLSVTSSWGNGHATTYRALLRELANLGHEILFLEKDVPWYSGQRDMPEPTFCDLGLYKTNEELRSKYTEAVANADVVIVGSYVQQGVEVGNWAIDTATGATAFYDIDTPVTLAKLERQDYEYLDPATISRYDMYLSFSGGPILDLLEQQYGSPMAKPLYCSVDTQLYFPEEQPMKWQMGYLGTYSNDRQPTVEELLNKTAAHFPEKEFVVAGPQYPDDINWAKNVQRINHLPPAQHRAFYNSQRFTLNVTREDMIRAGYSPSVRLFEAAACGVPIISDHWDGIESIFEPGKEILLARSTEDVLEYFRNITEEERKQIGNNARNKVLQHHTAKARARELVEYVNQLKETTKV
jgi:spore maturation protein CgeB